MGVDFSLMCDDCKEFLSLHKWAVVPRAAEFLVQSYYGKTLSYTDPGQLRPEDSPYPICDLDSSCHKSSLSTTDVLEAVDSGHPDQQYIRKLVPSVRMFAVAHTGHPLFLVCDLGVEPWDFSEPSFTEWREVPGECYFHSYLPRNLIEVHGLARWENVEEFLQENHWWLLHEQLHDELCAIRQAFEARRVPCFRGPSTE